jgi:hypothetical protein
MARQEAFMKGTKLLAIAVSAALLGGCSTASLNPFGGDKNFTVSQPGDNTTAVKDTTVAVTNDDGIKIYYTLLGDLDRIEVYGVAETWKGNVEIRAEADAKERLVKYLYEEKVDTQRSIEVTTKTLDKARDDALNRIENGLGAPSIVEFDAETVEAEVAQEQASGAPKTTNDNTSRRVAERVEQTKVSALTKITSGGTLRGMRKINGGFRNDGKVYFAVYRWSEKDQGTANEIRSKMFAK